MIAFLGLSPAWQQVYRVAELSPGAVHRATATAAFASGKATNAAIQARRHRADVALATVAGGHVGSLFEGDLLSRRLRLILARGSQTRVCTTVIAAGGATELIEENGVQSPAVADELLRGIRGLNASVVCGCGSIPSGAGDEVYARLIHSAGSAASVIDASGRPLRLACEAGATLVKPNRAELAATVGRELRTAADVEKAAARLRTWGTEWVLVTDGPNDALLLGETAEWIAPPAVEVVSPIGAGDALCGRLAAALADGVDVPVAARLGLQAAADHCRRDPFAPTS